MAGKGTSGFWAVVARIILRNRILILAIIAGITIFFGTQWKHMRFTYSEANLLPDDHPVNQVYNDFLDLFGEEGNLIVIAVKDSSLFTPNQFHSWNTLSKKFNAIPEVSLVLSSDNLLNIKKDTVQKKFVTERLLRSDNPNLEQITSFKKTLFEKLPFYDNLLYNKETGTLRTIIYMDKDLVNTAVRKDFVFNDLIPEIKNFEKETGLDVHVSGMPYVRTLNAQNIVDEMGVFILAALGVTSIIFFFFFRSIRATFISMCIVIIGVMWAFGILGLLRYEITVLTAIIPPLIIVIGIPNCIFLINKYQQEVKKHGNQAKSLQRVISKIGNATLMTNATTAAGFATFMITESKLLKEFGLVASVNIIAIFILSLFIIPILYSFMAVPKDKHLKHLSKTWINRFVNWMEQTVRHKRITIYITSVALLVASIIGIYMIRVSGSLIEDMPKGEAFFKDIRFFEQEFNGIMPIEIVINTKKKNGVMKLPTLNRMDKLGTVIEEIPELSKPLSAVNLVKFLKQSYYNGNPKYYQLPRSQESSFIMPWAKNASNDTQLLSSFVDSTGQIARITTFLKDTKTERMEEIEEELQVAIAKFFPAERYEVHMTGKALLFLKGTKYLIKNLIISLGLAIALIALFMAYMFRSARMIIVSLIPNLLPLLITAGLMGFIGVPIKPSTILVFSIAFGISVDDTIHFLAKYRQELQANHWRIRKSVYAALRETGVSMFYTSIVLFFGFSVFIISTFGGTVALGALVSTTLLFAMLANLVLLPALLISLERSIANKKVMMRNPKRLIIPKDQEEEETI